MSTVLTTIKQNRLLQTIRQQQIQLQQLQAAQGITLPSTGSTSTIEDSVAHTPLHTPLERSSSSAGAGRTRSPATPHVRESPLLRPGSSSLQHHTSTSFDGDSGSGLPSPALPRDEVAFYQAENQSLTRENQILKQRIRELGKSL